MKTLVIGDIHGCYTELLELLDKAGLGEDDRIIGLGDIVDRGPDTPQVLDFFCNSPARLSLMGNHERKHVRGARHLVRLARAQVISREQFGATYAQALQAMEAFPLFIELPEATLVHGYLEPGIALEDQRDVVLCGTMTGEQYLRKQYGQPWYALYEGAKPVIAGHHDILRNGQPFIYQERVFCLDTSCVHGGNLTGLLLPEFRIVSVPSRGDHWREMQRKHAPLKPAAQKASPGLYLPQGWVDESEQTLAKIIALAQAEARRIWGDLQDRTGFCELTPRQQAKAYAAAVGRDMPWAALLHQVRTGEISLEAARRLFKSDLEMRELLARLNGSG